MRLFNEDGTYTELATVISNEVHVALRAVFKEYGPFASPREIAHLLALEVHECECLEFLPKDQTTK